MGKVTRFCKIFTLLSTFNLFFSFVAMKEQNGKLIRVGVCQQRMTYEQLGKDNNCFSS